MRELYNFSDCKKEELKLKWQTFILRQPNHCLLSCFYSWCLGGVSLLGTIYYKVLWANPKDCSNENDEKLQKVQTLTAFSDSANELIWIKKEVETKEIYNVIVSGQPHCGLCRWNNTTLRESDLHSWLWHSSNRRPLWKPSSGEFFF